MKYLLLICAFGLMIHSLFADDPSISVGEPSQMVPKVLRDPKTKVIFYLESDRRHLSAIGPDGALLWQIDSYPELSKGEPASIKPLKVNALINFIGFFKPENRWAGLLPSTKEDFLSVSFNSNEFGLIKKSTGEFIWKGRD